MYLLNDKPKMLDTSDYQILKMNNPSFTLECTTRAPSSGEKENEFASQLYFLSHLIYDTQFDTVGNEEITKYKCKEIKCWIQNE